MRRRISRIEVLSVAAPFIGFLAALVILLLIVLAVGERPSKAVEAILRMTTGNPSRLATVLSQAIPLFLAGIAVAIAFRASVFNIGAEGQYFFGGFVGALAGIYLQLPAFLHIPVVVLASMLGGAMYAAIPALLKVTRGVHEVITTIMFNSIAVLLVNFLVNRPFSGIEGGESLEPQTAAIQETALFGRLNPLFRALGWKVGDHVYLDYSLVVAIVMGFLLWFLIFKTRYGFEIRAVGTAPDASRYAGMRIERVQVGAFLLSGGLAGLIGLQEIFAIRGFYSYEIARNLGFDGIAIALIGRNNPVGVVFGALLFSFLKQAGYGLQLYTSVPNSVTDVITGVMIIIIVVTNEIIARYIKRVRQKEAG
ncbi:MAG: ABC transporter permease [Spirochaetaceae bacterium]